MTTTWRKSEKETAFKMNVFISGGCKNGKSFYAQRRARDMARQLDKPLYYVATMIPRDDEDRARIKRHLAERDGWGFETLERGKELPALLHGGNVDRDGVFLLDSVTALLGNEMFDETGAMDESAAERVKLDVLEFASKTGNTVFVSDYIYGDCGDYSETTRAYMKGLASIDRALASVCDEALEVAYGSVEKWK